MNETSNVFNKQEASKSIKFYQRLNEGDSEKIHMEINKLKTLLCKSEKCDEVSFSWSDLVTNPGRKALIIGAVLVSLIELCGSSTTSSYGAKIFQEAESIVSPNISVILVQIIQILGSCVAMNLVDRAGRRVRLFFIELIPFLEEKKIIFISLVVFSVFIYRINNWSRLGFNHFRRFYDVKILELCCC